MLREVWTEETTEIINLVQMRECLEMSTLVRANLTGAQKLRIKSYDEKEKQQHWRLEMKC